MFTKCPRCNSLNVRPSSLRVSKVSAHRIFLALYRCRDCKERFWVTSKTVYFLGAVLAVAIMAGAIGLIMWGIGGDPPRASERAAPVAARFSDMLKRAESGDPVAEYEVAQTYAGGDGVPKNEKEARAWLERAARDGNADAQYEFGIALREGRGTVQDYERALDWLQLAADAGNAQAQFELGRMYLAGTGVPVDKLKAYTWLNLSAAQGVTGAAPLRDVALGQLSPEQVVKAQAEARRLSEGRLGPPAKAQ